MEASQERIVLLLIRHIHGELTEAENTELQAWKALSTENRALAEDFMEEAALARQLEDVFSKHRVWERVAQAMSVQRPAQQKSVLRRLYPWGWAAAVLLVIAVVAGMLLRHSAHKEQVLAAADAVVLPDVAPGGDKARLTLADGSVVLLDSTRKAGIRQGGAAISQQGGVLQYTGEASGFNMLQTPRGGQYRVELADGTRVWLNAASSLRYPLSFDRHSREVFLDGEAYFEVAGDVDRPFLLHVSNRMDVTVLGTAFNVNAYPDEPDIRTTLLEGSVRVGDTDKNQVVLHPGQQAAVSGAGAPLGQFSPSSAIRVTTVDAEAAIAWQQGVFNLEGKPLDAVMREMARWYDLNVVYEGPVPAITFRGKMSRNIRFSKVENYFSVLGIHMRIDDNKTVVISGMKK